MMRGSLLAAIRSISRTLFTAADVVMLLVSVTLRVALATTHLPLRDVPDAINQPLIEHTLTVTSIGRSRNSLALINPVLRYWASTPMLARAGTWAEKSSM